MLVVTIDSDGPTAGCDLVRRLRALVRLERCEAAVAPSHACRDLIGVRRSLPQRQQARELLARIDRRVGGAQPRKARAVAFAVVRMPPGALSAIVSNGPMNDQRMNCGHQGSVAKGQSSDLLQL